MGMVIFALLSIGAIYALIPVIIILILIAAAAGLRGGGDLFTLLGFGAIMQMASGFGAGGAGKGLSKSTEYKETMSTGSPTGAKVRLGATGGTIKDTMAARKAAKENAYLKSIGMTYSNDITASYLKEVNKTSLISLSSKEMRELQNRLDNPRDYLMNMRREAEKANQIGLFKTLSKTDSRTLISGRPVRIMGVNLVRPAVKVGVGGLEMTHTKFRHITTDKFIDSQGKPISGVGLSLPWAGFIKSRQEAVLERRANRYIERNSITFTGTKNATKAQLNNIDEFTRGNISNEYGNYGVGGITDWAYRMNHTPAINNIPIVGQFVGAYSYALAGVVIAARVPFYKTPPMASETLLPPPIAPWNAAAGTAGPTSNHPDINYYLNTHVAGESSSNWGDFTKNALKNTFKPRRKYI